MIDAFRQLLKLNMDTAYKKYSELTIASPCKETFAIKTLTFWNILKQNIYKYKDILYTSIYIGEHAPKGLIYKEFVKVIQEIVLHKDDHSIYSTYKEYIIWYCWIDAVYRWRLNTSSLWSSLYIVKGQWLHMKELHVK